MKTALVLSGGGAKGSNQVGILKGLYENKDFPIHAVYGTSVGALNAIGLSYLGIEGLEQIWLNIKSRSDIVSFNWLTLGPLFDSGIFNTKPLRKIITTAIQGNTPSLETKVCKVNIETGEVVYGTPDNRDFIDSVEASACIPFSMSSVNHIWVDGGCREITPLKEAIKDGADKIIAILASPWQLNPDVWKAPRGISFIKGFKYAMRAVDILSHEVFINDIKTCSRKNKLPGYKQIELEVYAPKLLYLDTLTFEPKAIQKSITHGYECYLCGPINI